MTNNGNLVRLRDIDDDFIIELRYATENNFTGQKIYPSGECYINENTAKRLIKAKDIFRQDGYRIKIWDAYRPLSVQKRFWELYPDDNFIGQPPDMSKITEFRPRHLNGMSVDITLTDIEGNEIIMPTAFDEFFPQAALEANDHESEGYKNALYMKNVMEVSGFGPYCNEWWHFNDIVTEPVPYLDIIFDCER